MNRVCIMAAGLMTVLAAGAGAQDNAPQGAQKSLTISTAPGLSETLVPALVEGFILEDGGRDLLWRGLGASGGTALVVGTPGQSKVGYVEVILSGNASADVTVSAVPADQGAKAPARVVAYDGIALVVPEADQNRFTLERDEALRLIADTAKQTNAIAAALGASAASDRVTRALLKNPDAVGILSTSVLHHRDLPLRSLRIRSCGPAYSPTRFAIKTGDYPLTRHITMAGEGDLADKFTSFALSQRGQALVEEVGFINLQVELSRLNSSYITELERSGALNIQNAQVFRAYLLATEGAQKLSAILTFDKGGTGMSEGTFDKLDASLALLRKAKAAGRQVLVFGFADSEGYYKVNRALASERAQAVAQRLKANGITPKLVRDFAEEIPAACNNLPKERHRNRRVELWVR